MIAQVGLLAFLLSVLAILGVLAVRNIFALLVHSERMGLVWFLGACGGIWAVLNEIGKIAA